MKRNKNIKKILFKNSMMLFFAALLFVFFTSSASAANTGNTFGWAWSERSGWIHFDGDSSSQSYGVITSGAALSGKAYAENGSYFSFSGSCSETSGCPDGGDTYSVSASETCSVGTRCLSGWAWGEGLGWVRLAATGSDYSNDSTTDYGVYIDSDGGFHGYAWGETSGYVKFAGSCAETGGCPNGGDTYAVDTNYFPVTEFVSVVDPGASAESDYSSLSTWNTGVATDLTAASTMVFAGTKTGTINDNASVTGATSGATATVVHANKAGTQLLLESVSGGPFQNGEQIRVDVSNYFTTSNTGNSAIAVAKCRTTTGQADTTAVTITGWTTSAANYIKVWTDPSENYRHKGVWDEGKYRLELTNNIDINISEDYVRLDGLQLKVSAPSNNSNYAVYIGTVTAGANEIWVSGSILQGVLSGTSNGNYAVRTVANSNIIKIWNNIIYGWSVNGYQNMGLYLNGGTAYVYNNTIYGNNYGIRVDSGTAIVKNNISYNNTSNYYNTFDASSAYNVTNTIPDSNIIFGASADSGTTTSTVANKLVESGQNFLTTVKVGMIIKNTIDNTYTYVTAVDSDTQLSVANDIMPTGKAYTIYTNMYGSPTFEDSANYDFHLDSSDTVAKNKGANLYADTYIPVTTDIDGNARPNSATTFDIGADENVAKIYRSVGPSATTALTTGTSNYHSNHLTISGVTATFEYPLDDNIGVGDAIQYDANADGSITATDGIAFIDKRFSSVSYRIKKADGTAPTAMAIPDIDWSLFRAYTSLSLAEAGTENVGIDGDLVNFDTGNVNLTTNNLQWNFACYANGTTGDGTAVTISGWGTSADNYLKFYTPTAINEVGISQRHSGVFTTSKYKHTTNSSTDALYITEVNYVEIDGLQIDNAGGRTISHNGISSSAGWIKIENSIINGNASAWNGTINLFSNWGIVINAYINNNIITTSGIDDYDIDIQSASITAYVYGNTLISNYCGLRNVGTALAKNNISYAITLAFSGTFAAGTGYNATNKATMNYTVTGGAVGDRTSQTFSFVDSANGDYHLLPSDAGAKNYGTDLSNDSIIQFNTDIDSNGIGTNGKSCGSAPSNVANNGSELCYTRPRGTTWDIGADEVITPIYRSVAPEADGDLGAIDDDNSQADTLSITTAGVATFEVAVADNVGVGDAIVFDDDADNDLDASDTILFIHGRTDSTHYTVRTDTGGFPTASTTDNDKWAIYRAYTSLSLAEAGTKNTAIPISFTGGNRDIAANSEQWNIACYANGTTADTTAVDVRGWTTAPQNYIRIYTSYLTTEVGTLQRHLGKWDENKYKLVTTNPGSNVSLRISDSNVRIDGIQIDLIKSSGSSSGKALYVSDSSNRVADVRISNNIIKGQITYNPDYVAGIHCEEATSTGTVRIWNNIVYDFNLNYGYGIFLRSNSSKIIYNNTIVNSVYYGIKYYDGSADITLKNNIVQGATDGYQGTFNSISDYNLSDIATDAPGTNSRNSTTVTFADATNKDFHLSSLDAGAKDYGADLSNDPIWQLMLDSSTRYRSLGMTGGDDIDGAGRPMAGSLAWDIGADEVSTAIYRSVGPSKTDYLDRGVDESGTDMSITGSTATIENATPDNVGVGDVIQYDSDNNGTVDALAFITARTSSSQYTVKSAIGGTPIPTTVADQDWGIYRAYSALYFAERGDENTGLTDTVENFDDWTVGGVKDADDVGKNLLTYNEQWNIAAYANGGAADTTQVSISDWTTGPLNYLKVYTPTATTEVGTSQRHQGKLDTSKYWLNVNHAGGGATIRISIDYVRIEGLQTSGYSTSGWGGAEIMFDIPSGVTDSDTRISNNIFKTDYTMVSDPYDGGLMSDNGWSNNGGVKKIYNNIMYGIKDSHFNLGIITYGGTWYVYNNTIVNPTTAINQGGGTMIAKNNIVQNASDGFNGYSAGSDYNISNIASDAPSASYRNGLATTVTFEDAANFDFHLSSVDVGARDVGADLSADPYLSVTQDIDGHTRNVSSHTGNFDIGADEGATAMYFSVGQNTTTHETGAGDVDVDATTKTATFTVAQTATNMGVGDVIDYDSDNKKCYITGKTSTSVWTCVSATGTAPTDSGGNVTVNSISHAFQYLHNAIDSGHNGVGDATHLNTLDLWTNNYQLNVPCYYDSAADATAVEINGWTTGAPNYLRIYTPNNIATEVNQSQRHSGKWDEGKYRIEFTGEYGGDTFYVRDNNVKVSGLEINIHGQTNGIFRGILFYPNSDVLGDSIEINDNIIKGDWTGSAYGVGITGYTNLNNKSTTFKAWNNIIYDMSNGSNGSGIYIDDGYDVMARAYVYNNTIYNSYIGIHRTSGYAYLKNNIVQNCTDGYSGTMDASSDYNISNVASDAPSASYRSGQATTVTFQDSTNKDFHLGLTDTMARNVGANLSSDSSFAFATDIDGNGRGTWDIGADEGSVEAVASVMEGGGDYSSLSSWETGMQTDLTSTATMVYAGTLTSTIADNASLYLCRGGVYQNVTSNTVHVTSTQLLAEIISTPTSVASGDVWYTNNTCNSANYFTTTDAGNPAIAVAKIDGAWSSADTNVVSFDGWVTGLTNYAKIYTTTAARHQGKWDDTKYNLNNQIVLWETYVYIDGMQINTSGTDYGIFMYGPPYVPAGEVNVVNSIIKSRNSVFGGYGSGTGQITKFSNNIMHSSERPYIAIGGIGEYFYLYNNTIITNGMFGYTSGATHEIVKNNIIQGATSYGYYGSFDASSTNNLSNLADAPGSNPQNSKSVIFADAGGEDYHLSQNDTSAKNMGADLSADTYLPIDDDIDGQTRNATTSNFDIGADETAIQVFYSVGQNTSNHMTGTPTVTIASGVGTFSAAQTATNMGVGDKITYNTNVVAYISEKISDVKWKLITATGGTPADITGSTVVSIAHAYASLSLAEAGIPTPLGTSDLVTGNYQVNIPCYYDTGADVTPVDVSGWTTGANNYIKIYTPNSTVSEVNQSQRHSGKWDDEKYSLNTGRTNWNIWSWNGVDIWIDGLQFKGYGGVVFYHIVSASVAKVSNCILDGDNETVSGIEAYYLYAGSTFYAWNNIIYGFASGGWYGGITASPTTSVSYIYNNTVIVGSGYNNFAYAGNSSTHFKNNIGQGGLIGYSFYGAPFNADSSNNLTDDTSAPGSNSRISITPTFADTATSDYRLSLADTGAKDYGTDLSSEGSTFGMTGIEKDISGNYRTSTWDIGASEAGQTVFQSEALEKNSIADGLVLYQSFNGEDINGTTAIDRSGNGNDGTISGATAAMGKRGQALDFDGSSGYVTAGTLGDAAMTENGPMAISAWIYPRSDGQASQGFIVARDGNAGPYFQMYPSNKLIFAVPGGTQLYRLSLDNSISYNAWQHVVVTWDGSTNASNVHLYVNGFQSDGATNNGTSLTDNSASNLYIGNNPYYNRTFDGSLDEVRVYNRVLSTDEIGSLYKLGEAKMNSPQATNANNGLVLSQSFDGRYMDWSQASAEARDASGQNNHGDVVGATATIGKRGQALSFNGNSDYVAVSGNPLGTGEATIGAWIKPTSVSSCRIYSSSAFPYSDFEIDGSNSRLFFTNDAGVTAAVSANSSITANSWQFVTAVRNSSNQVTIYINGSQSGTANQSAGTPTGGSTSNYIGTRFDHGSGFFPGKIDEVRIYNRALSSDEVKDLYKMGEVKVSK